MIEIFNKDTFVERVFKLIGTNGDIRKVVIDTMLTALGDKKDLLTSIDMDSILETNPKLKTLLLESYLEAVNKKLSSDEVKTKLEFIVNSLVEPLINDLKSRAENVQVRVEDNDGFY
ncbi:hypothetical protein HDE_04237 [Halotydeus destructor]|nr:hypothetical protein HDE_04237 [Halotydeus destructor]